MPASRKTQIATATLDLLAEGGLASVSTRAIARAVGLSDGAIFRHFASKQAMCAAALHVVDDALAGTFPDPTLPPLRKLEHLFCERARLVHDRPSVGAMLNGGALLLGGDALLQDRARAWHIISRRHVAAAILDASARGSLREEVSVEDMVLVVEGTLLAVSRSAAEHGALPPALRAARTWASLAHLLRKPSI